LLALFRLWDYLIAEAIGVRTYLSLLFEAEAIVSDSCGVWRGRDLIFGLTFA
jgi:hypothetical protein